MDGIRSDLEQHEYAYLTTRGRRSGRPHRIEIWFVVADGSIWLMAGGGDRSDWVRNLLHEPAVDVEVGDDTWGATAVVHRGAADHPVRRRMAARYQGWRTGQPLSEWATTALLVELRP